MEKPEYITEKPDGSLTVKLATPINVDGIKLSAVTMREPTVGDELAAATAAGKSVEQMELVLFGNLCGLTPADLHAMTLRNYRRLQGAYQLFTE